MAKVGFEFVSPALVARLDTVETSPALAALTKADRLEKSFAAGNLFDVAEDKVASARWDAYQAAAQALTNAGAAATPAQHAAYQRAQASLSRLVVAVASAQYATMPSGHLAVFVDRLVDGVWQPLVSFTSTMTGAARPPYVDLPWDGRALTLRANIATSVACDLGCVVTTMKAAA